MKAQIRSRKSKYRQDKPSKPTLDRSMHMAMTSERDSDKKYRESIASSTGMILAMQSNEQERIAFIANIPFQVRPEGLVEYLASLIGGIDLVARCEFHKNRQGLFNGCAFVTLKNSDAFEELLSQKSCCLQGRTLNISEAHRRHVERPRKDSNVCSVAVDSVMIGTASAPDSAICTRWKLKNERNFLEINGHGARQVVIQISEENRLEFAFKHTTRDGVGLFIGADGKRIIRFRLRRPPFCLKKSEGGDLFESHLSRIMIGITGTGFVWDPEEALYADSDRQKDFKWERVSNISGYFSFGLFLVYDLVMTAPVGSNADNKVLACFKEFKLHRYDRARLPSSFSEVNFIPSNADDWSGGHDDLFTGLEFDICFLLHALVGGNILSFHTRAEAVSLAAALRDCAVRDAANILSLAFYRHPCPSTDTLSMILSKLVLASRRDSDVAHDSDEGAQSCDSDESGNLVSIRRVLVTPLRICPQPAQREASNRILRQCIEHKARFLRVTFVEENFGSVLSARSADIFERRIRPIMRDGVCVAGRRFVFLAYSNSQLREQSCWFYDEAPRPPGDSESECDPPPSAEEIRRSMGDLSEIKVVGRHAARLAQGFSTTTCAPSVLPQQMEVEADVERGNYCFSDGIGLISERLAKNVAALLPSLVPAFSSSLSIEARCPDVTPSAFQIRLRGCKGVVVVWPEPYLRGKELILRKSMVKFEGSEIHQQLEVCSFSKPMPCYLNRQVITLLSTLGISDQTFIDLLVLSLTHLDGALKSSEGAALMVGDHAPKSTAMRMLSGGFDVTKDRHLRELVLAIRNRQALDLKRKARILVRNGVNLLGVLDESGDLLPDAIYFSSTATSAPPAGTRIVGIHVYIQGIFGFSSCRTSSHR
jgi:hypothetical protein